MNRLFFTLLTGLVLTASLPAQQTYRILIKEPQQGDRQQCEIREHTQTSNKILGEKNKVLSDQGQTITQNVKYYEEILNKKAGDPHPSRLRRYYYKAEAGVNSKPQSLSFEKKNVLITRNDKGNFTFTLEKDQPIKSLGKLVLNKEFNANQAFDLRQAILPTQAVRLNEAWKMDLRPIAKNWQEKTGMQIDLRAAVGTGRLTKVYKKDGATFGAISLKVEMPITKIGKGEQAIKTDPGSKVVMIISLDACIDGKVGTGTLDAQFQVSAAAPISSKQGKKARMLMSVGGAFRKSRTELPPKAR